ncbi:hypothetical protein C8R47DRAFT_1196127 [Mycena vitilis]|nr:hypothetical protein C8R47DRAFT_1196127 [Mycena vitilis]
MYGLLIKNASSGPAVGLLTLKGAKSSQKKSAFRGIVGTERRVLSRPVRAGTRLRHRKTNTVDPIVKTSSLGNIEVVEEHQALIFPFVGTIMASKVASVKKSKQHVTKEEKARRHRKAQAEYRARNPHLREKERIKAAERNLALKANRRRWDPPKVPKVATTQSSRPESVQHGLVGSIEDKTHSFRDPRARSDLSFSGKPRRDSEEPAAGTSDSPTPEERLACSALAQLAQGVTLADLDEDSSLGARKLTDDELAQLGAAIIKRKSDALQGQAAPLAGSQGNRGLFILLTHSKVVLNAAAQLFQIRNNARIHEECVREGHDSLNEAAVAKAQGTAWVDDDDAVQVARVKELARARLALRTRVVKALFAQASDEELAAIAQLMEQEKAGDIVGCEEDGDMVNRSPAEYQASIDESWLVVKRFRTVLAEMTGWYGFTMWGGPNPSLGGELSMKSFSYGLTPAGNDFEAAHAKFEEGLVLPYQIFLSRHPGERIISRQVETQTESRNFSRAITPCRKW